MLCDSIVSRTHKTVVCFYSHPWQLCKNDDKSLKYIEDNVRCAKGMESRMPCTSLVWDPHTPSYSKPEYVVAVRSSTTTDATKQGTIVSSVHTKYCRIVHNLVRSVFRGSIYVCKMTCPGVESSSQTRFPISVTFYLVVQ